MKIVVRTLFLCGLSTLGFVNAQTSPTTTTVTGTVVDAATGHGIADARVNAIPGQPGITSRPEAVTTDDQGRFQMEVQAGVRFLVDTSKQGWTRGSGELTDGVKIEMTLYGALHGKIVDAATGEPVSGIPVTLTSVGTLRENPWAIGRAFGRTDQNGEFLRELSPTTRPIIQIAPQIWSAPPENAPREAYMIWIGATGSFTNEQISAVDQDYRMTFWPRADSGKQAVPAPYNGMGDLDTGIIALEKIPYYRALVRFPAEICVEDVEYEGALYSYADQRGGNTFGLKVPCGVDIILRGLLPEVAYRLELSDPEQSPADRVYFSADFTMGGGNAQYTLAPAETRQMRVRLVGPGGTALAPEVAQQVAVTINPLDSERFEDLQQPVPFDAEGIADMGLRRPGLVDLSVSASAGQRTFSGNGLTTMMMSAVRIGLAEVNTVGFMWDGYAEIEVEMETNPGAVQGVVTQGATGVPVGGARVFVYKLPITENSLLRQAEKFFADDSGRFITSALAAGEYKLIGLGAGALLEDSALAIQLVDAPIVRVNQGQITEVQVHDR